MDLGARLYAEKCAMCHQANGAGVPPVFPPLAKSDWLAENRERTIRVLCEGLSGPITVNGTQYNSAMPAQILTDEEAAAVLSYIGGSWGNAMEAFTAKEVKAARSKTKFKTYEALVKATTYQPLPNPPSGWKVREVVQLPEFFTRMMASPRAGFVHLLTQGGSIYLLEVATGALQPTIPAADYLTAARGSLSALGATLGPQGDLWIVTNQRLEPGKGAAGELVENEVVIYRTTEVVEGNPVKPRAWLTMRYPYGVGPYNHGVSQIAFGPDGMLYVNSGSRTDGGEAGPGKSFYTGGEVDTTACIWKLDSKAEQPKIEVYARGIRNAFGFAWDDQGRFFSATNGPDAHTAEELDLVEPGKHYGFPFQFADWPIAPGSPYPHTPAPPADFSPTLPVINRGPAGGGSAAGLSTFDAHSSPGGMIWCGADFPPPLGGTFLMSRFGNLIGLKEDVGFDVLSVKIKAGQGERLEAEVHSILAPLGRPIDVIQSGPGRALILEYTRPTNHRERLGWLPGRVIELAPAAPTLSNTAAP